MIKLLFEKTKIPLLQKALGAYSLRQKAIAANIANVNTVGYKRVDVAFEEQLAEAVEKRSSAIAVTNERHIPIGASSLADVEPTVIEDAKENMPGYDSLASGVNDVDIDMEMAELAKNQLRFKFAARLLAGSFRSLQNSIRGQS